MVDFISLGGIIGLLISTLVAFVALVLSDTVIAHGIEAKRLLIMSLVALFIAPIAGSFLSGYIVLSSFVFAYAVPLAVWIILGEVLLTADMMTKVKVAAVGFVVYIILSLTVAPYIYSIL